VQDDEVVTGAGAALARLLERRRVAAAQPGIAGRLALAEHHAALGVAHRDVREVGIVDDADHGAREQRAVVGAERHVELAAHHARDALGLRAHQALEHRQDRALERPVREREQGTEHQQLRCTEQ